MSEFPDKKETNPDLYTGEEFNCFIGAAHYEDVLLIYAFITSGMRDKIRDDKLLPRTGLTEVGREGRLKAFAAARRRLSLRTVTARHD